MRKIFKFREITSTQDKAKEIAGQNPAGGTVVVASVQTGGKGRFGREWLSPGGGLWFSVILYPGIAPGEISKLTMIAGVAAVEAIRVYCGVKLGIKWPNDIVFKDRKEELKKVGGILTEASLKGKKVENVIMGMGINVNNSLAGSGLPAVSLRQILGRKVSLESLLKEILKQFDNYCLVFDKSGIGAICEKCRELSVLTGRKVVVDCGKNIIEGVVTDIKNDGSLMLKSNGRKVNILAGDIKILKL